MRPNQRSTRGEATSPATDLPTAVQVRFSGQETPRSELNWDPAVFGVDWTCQPVPSQRSASVKVPRLPTAVQARSPEHETASSLPFAMAGPDWSDQRIPFQSSTSGPESELPTAKQTFGRGHDTPFSELKVAPGGLGVATILQLVPFQCSASVALPVPGPVVLEPTAMQDVADEQSTANRLLVEAPSTFGVGGTVHAADAADGARSIAAIANKTRLDGRRDICTATLPAVNARVKRAWEAAMETDGAAEAMRVDGVRPEAVQGLVEA